MRGQIMPRGDSPFPAEHVGSLLHPAVLKAARARHERGDIDAAELASIEDREIDRQDGGARHRQIQERDAE